ncbi:hypothetical protein DMA11_23315 [Marinilabiliaceae bacterium JC017]|nr:hypothetical protein DMA11_23315 [Marinilabiliaceae bacterium JC017]
MPRKSGQRTAKPGQGYANRGSYPRNPAKVTQIGAALANRFHRWPENIIDRHIVLFAGHNHNLITAGYIFVSYYFY